MKLLILRPQPGAARSAARAQALGLDPVVAPLFMVRPLEWEAPDPGGIEAVLLTSANAARFGGETLAKFFGHPCYAVGPSTAAAARETGFGDVRIGPGDAAALIEMVAREGVARALHPAGRDHLAVDHPQITIMRRFVYASDAVDALPEPARRALETGALALLHSPRAARLFAALVDAAALPRRRVSVAAISEPVAAAAGYGWKTERVALAPRDDALLELAAKLCQNGGQEMGTSA